MKNLQKRLVCVMLSILMIVAVVWIPKTMVSRADGFTVTITSTAQTVKVGENFTVIVVASGSNIGLIRGSLQVSGDGVATVADPKVGLNAMTLQAVYTYTATQAGTVTIGMQVDSALPLDAENQVEDQVTCTVNSCTVTITEQPTEAPTDAPTEAPTDVPTEAPTEAPTVPPTEAPTVPPTEAPTAPPETLSSNAKLDALSIHPV